MKKLLVLVFILTSLTSFGQFLNYTNINGRYKWIAGKFDSTFTIPVGTSPSLRTGGGNAPGALFYSTTDSTVYQYTGTQWTRLRGSDTAHVISAYVRNTTASPMTPGQVVYINGSTGTTPTIALANNKQDSTSAMTFGFVRGNIPVNGFGYITTFGPLEGVNTNAYTEGEVIYLDSISGQFTHDKPKAPYHMVTLGYIIKKSGGNGTIYAKIQNGYELDELHNVRITEPVLNKSVIIYDSVKGYWVDTTVSAAGLGLGGSGTTNYVSKWTGSTALGNSQIFDNGTSVGIGTATPNYLVTAYSTSATTARVQMQGTTNYTLFQATNSSGDLWMGIENSAGTGFGQAAYTRFLLASGSYPLVLGTGSSGAMTIFPSLRIGIGTSTDAGYRLDVSGTARFTGQVTIDNTTGNELVFAGSQSANISIPSGDFYISAGSSKSVNLGANNRNSEFVLASGRATFNLAGTTNNVIISPFGGEYTVNVAGNFKFSNLSTAAILGGASNTEIIQFDALSLVGAGRMIWTNTAFYFRAGTGADLSLGSNNTNDRILIKSGGNVLIGTTTDAGYKLSVNGTIKSTGFIYAAGGNIGVDSDYGIYSTGNVLEFGNGGINGTERMRIDGAGSVGIGTTSVNASALLDVSSTTKGFLPPRMTNAQMVAISTPAAGLVVYDTTNNKLNVYDGTNWVTLH